MAFDCAVHRIARPSFAGSNVVVGFCLRQLFIETFLYFAVHDRQPSNGGANSKSPRGAARVTIAIRSFSQASVIALTMKITCLIDGLVPGGAQRQLCMLAVLLKKRGMDVSMLTYHNHDFFLPMIREAGLNITVWKATRCRGKYLPYAGHCGAEDKTWCWRSWKRRVCTPSWRPFPIGNGD